MPKKQPRKLIMQVASDSEDEIQAYHKQKDKILLNSDQEDVEDSEEEEVYGIDESDSEDEITLIQQQLRQIRRNKIKNKLDDLEDDTEDEALPDSRAWGNKKSWFMGGDVRDNKIILSGSEDEAGAAALEEEELRKLRERRLQNLTEEDYFPPSLKMMLDKMNDKGKKKQKKSSKISDEEEEAGPSDKTKTKKKKKKETKKKKSSVEGETGEVEKIKIKTDLSEEAEYERMKQMHPEFLPLVEDFKSKMQEFRKRILPLMSLVRKGLIDGVGATYILMKYNIISNYLICGGFYMYFVMKKTPRLHHHPVMKRLLEFQQFYNRLVPTDQREKPELDEVLELLRQGKEVAKITCAQVGRAGAAEAAAASGKKKARKAVAEEEGGPVAKRRKTQARQEEEDDDFEGEEEGDDDGEEELGNMDEAEDEEEDDDDEEGQERRAITKEMEKNKGVTAHKKKDQKNPRVKHRKKYRRALIRRKGQVRDYKVPKTAYSGEMTGIRAGIIRSRKLK